MTEMHTDDWYGCYRESWKGVLTEESFVHPARFSRSLIRRIYQHASEEGWIVPGSTVIDPFGGVAAGALDAMLLGCHWVGNELEGRFCGLAQENLAEWQHRYGHRPGWGSGRILQGDSRNLAAVIREAYGNTEGQLGAMREGKNGFDLGVSSPPWEKGAEGVLRKEKFKDPEAFAAEMVKNGKRNPVSAKAQLAQLERDAGKVYGDSAGQVGRLTGDDFWSAARKIVEQTYLVLSPGAHAIWVLKGFVRKGKYVDFPDQWRQLCEACGFRTLHIHRAWLVEHKGEQLTLDGGADVIKTEKKSLFRRNAEKKGAPPVDFEVVLCCER